MKPKRRINKKTFRWVSDIFSSPVKAFILLAGIFGMLIVFLAPPLTGADEEAHFVRAYGISQGDFRLYDTRQVSVPESFRKTLGCYQTKTSEPGVMYDYDYSQYGVSKKLSLSCALGVPLEGDKAELVYTSAQSYSPTTYIPQVIAIFIGRVFDAPIVVMVYLVRLLVLAAYIFMVVVAIRLLPIRKWALAGIALLPTPMILLTNPGGDYMLFGSISILAAVVIRSIFIPRKQLDRENKVLMAILAIAAIMMVLPKGIFPGICFLPLVAFYGGLGYQKLRKIFVVASALIIGLLWQRFGVNVDLITMDKGINSPFDFPIAFLETMFVRWVDTDFVYFGDYVSNASLSGEHLGMPALIITVINILFAVYLFVGYPEKAKIQLPKKQVLAFIYTTIICVIAVIIGSFGALFVGASYLQTAGTAIRGVQTRYLFPAFFVLAVTPFLRKVFIEDEKSMARIVIVGSIICLSVLVVVSAIAYRWWNPF
ncbi:MAG: DUF2142 domain-containing protein [Candidatus Microsaccharimonas sp.]